MAESNLDVIDESLPHELLEPPYPAYSTLALRRAALSWTHCGAGSDFKLLCNYYHRLEEWEDTLPADRRAMSRHLEYNMLCSPPPKSTFQLNHFPKLYSHSHIQARYIRKLEAIRNEQFVFHLEGFHAIEVNGATKKDVINLNLLIRKHCKERVLDIRPFLKETKEYLKRCRLEFSIDTVTMYIRKKAIKEEIQLEARFPCDFGFLHITKDEKVGKEKEEVQVVTIKKEDFTFITKGKDVTTKRSKNAEDVTRKSDAQKCHQNGKIFKVKLNQSLSKGQKTVIEGYVNQLKLMNAMKVKAGKVEIAKMLEVIDEGVCDSDGTQSSDVGGSLEDHERGSATDGESGIDCKSGDEGQGVGLKTNCDEEVSLNILQARFSKMHCSTIEKGKC